MWEDEFEERERLIERIRRLPREKLRYVEEAVRRLACGDLSALLTDPGRSASEAQRLAAEVAGKYPAVLALDLSGWNSPPWGDSYNRVVQNSIDGAKAWWEEGGLVAMQLHWFHPSNPEVMAEQGPAWVYCLSWWGSGQKHLEQWIKHTYNHEFVITRDELPPLKR